jgi:hypothetical protein
LIYIKENSIRKSIVKNSGVYLLGNIFNKAIEGWKIIMDLFFLCNTYMQVINAIQIRTKLFPDAVADIAISDHSNGSRQVYERLKMEKVFDKVLFVESRVIYFEQNKLEDIKDVWGLVTGKCKKFENLIKETREAYDYIFYYNVDFVLDLIYENSIKHGIKPMCVRFEEGIASYSNMKKKEITGGKRAEVIYKIRKMLGKPIVWELTNTFYCYYPNLLNQDETYKVHAIPKLQREDSELVNLLNYIFDYKESKEYKTKYIYFGMINNTYSGGIAEVDEINLIMQIAKRFGNDNFILKKHPRDTRIICEQNGIHVMKGSSIPWEVIQLNNKFDNQVFITISSGSILNATALLADNIETYILFPGLMGKDKKFDNYCENELKGRIALLQEEGVCMKHKFISDINEIESEAYSNE